MNGPTNYAEPMKRLLAVIIDGVVLATGALIIGAFTLTPTFVKLASITVSENEEEIADLVLESFGVFILFMFLYYVGYFLYFALQHSSKHQATLGKRAMKIYVTDEHGDRLTFGKAFLRMIGRIINGFTMGIGYLIILFTDKKQGVHDMIAKTLVLDGNEEQDVVGDEELL